MTTSATELDTVRAAFAAPGPLVAVGSRTQWEVGGPPPRAREVRVPRGIVAYEPKELTVTVRAGTTIAELEATLGEHGQEVVLDPRDPAATVGGVISTGCSGIRRLRYGPLRDVVLELRLITGDGREVRVGGPTVKNVTGYDLVRLVVGSLGTLAVIVAATLRARPRPRSSLWMTTDASPMSLPLGIYRPSALLWDGETTAVLLEGHDDDIVAAASRADLVGAPRAELPAGPHRGRISVDPARTADLGARLDELDLTWLAEIGVGTVHVAGASPDGLRRARDVAEDCGGWMLREAGAPDLDGFGVGHSAAELQGRVKAAFDPEDRLAPGRIAW